MTLTQSHLATQSPKKYFTALFFCCAATPLQASEPEGAAKLLITNDLTERYQQFVGGRNIIEIDNYHSPERGRQLAEVILFRQAIALGGYKKPTALWESPQEGYNNEIRRVSGGEVAAMAVTGWREDAEKINDKLLTSSPIIQEGEYHVGIYTHDKNTPLLSINHRQQLQNFTAVSSSEWSADWRTLNALPLKKIYDNKRWMAHTKMLATRRVDFMLLPFQNNIDLSLYYNPRTRTHLEPTDNTEPNKYKGIRLIPVPNVKIRVNGERCFYVSRSHPEGDAIYKALELGLKKLRKSGTIKRALTESKFFHPATKDWAVIN